MKHINYKAIYQLLRQHNYNNCWFYHVNPQGELTHFYGLMEMPLIEFMPACIRYEDSDRIAIIYHDQFNHPIPDMKQDFAFVIPTWRYRQIVELLKNHESEVYSDGEYQRFTEAFA